MRSFFIVMLFFKTVSVCAQKNEFVIDYINSYKQLAIEEMIRTGVPASIKLAQGIHETEAGQSDLVLKSNNHFGIKCKTGWQGEKVYHDDDARGECFRSYASSGESYIDHSNFLKNNQRYAFLFEMDPADYKAWAYGLKKAGYATNNKYSQILIKIIEEYNLQQYSLIALGRLAEKDELLTGANKSAEEKNTGSGPVASAELPALTEQAVIPVLYPSGEFIINKTRVLFAKAGTSLLELAAHYDISLSRLLDFNDLNQEEVLVHDQLIFLQRKRKTGESEFHIIQPGETVYSISQQEGIRLESLLQYNFLPSHLHPATGEKLYLQKQAPAQPRLAVTEIKKPVPVIAVNEEPAKNNGLNNVSLFITHIVQPRETLYGIAKDYNTTPEKIKEWNKLENTQLKKGQELIIYKK